MPRSSLSLRFGELGPAQPAPRNYFGDLQSASRSEVLAEAVRFFDLRNSGNRGIIKRNWPRLTFDILDRGIRALRHGYNRALQSSMHSLYSKGSSDFARYYNDVEQNFYKPYRRQSFIYHDKANRARFTARIFMSDLFRTERFVENKKRLRGHFQGIKLEQIPVKLSALRAALDDVLEHPALTAPPTDIVTQLRSDDETPTECLSEHLYMHAATVPRQRAAADVPPPIRRVHQAIDSIETALAGIVRFKIGSTANWTFVAWVRAIDELEVEFLRRSGDQAARFGLQWALVLTTILRAYLAELKLRVVVACFPIFNFYSEFRYNSYTGVCLWEAISGKPLKTPSIPNLLDIEVPTDNRYQLKFPAQHLSQDDRYGYITREGREQGALIGSLSSLLNESRQSILGATGKAAAEGAGERPSNTPEDIEGLVGRFLARPVIKSSHAPETMARRRSARRRSKRPSGLLDRYVFTDLTLDAFEEEVAHRNPVMLRGSAGDVRVGTSHRPNYYAITGIIPNPVSILNFGNTFSTQLLFYVACHLLQKVSEAFDLDGFYERQRASADRSRIRNLRKTLRSLDTDREAQYKQSLKTKLELQQLVESNRFVLTAGSYLHGGSFPPHKTHRDGRHLDISMGPNVTPWRTTGLRKALSEAWNYLRDHPFADAGKLKGQLRPRFESSIYVCERSASDVGKRALPILDHEFMRKLVNNVSAKVVEAQLDPVEEECYETQSDTIGKEIQRLYGTPHYLTSDDAELGHIGTLCIVLSGPTRIVYASPIEVLRCFRSLLRAVQQFYGRPLQLDHAGVANGEQLEERVRSLLRGIDIAFLPSDHHHHWHLYYPGFRPANPDTANTETKTAMEARLELLAPLWLLLGVDLSPFEGYLWHYKEGHLAHADLLESRQLEKMTTFCEEYAQLRQEHQSHEGAADISKQFLREVFLPQVLMGGPCSGNELDPAVDKLVAQGLIKRSNEIKWHLRAYRDELMRIYAMDMTSNAKAKALADKFDTYAQTDDDPEDAEDAEEVSGEERGLEYEHWTYWGGARL